MIYYRNTFVCDDGDAAAVASASNGLFSSSVNSTRNRNTQWQIIGDYFIELLLAGPFFDDQK